MKVTYEPEIDILTIRLKETPVSESDELQEGIIADYDGDGHIIGIEILDASRRVAEPHKIVFESKGHATPTTRAGGPKGGKEVNWCTNIPSSRVASTLAILPRE